MRITQRRIRLVAGVIAFAGAWALAVPKPAGAFVEACTQEQWAFCYCSASSWCEANMPPAPDGECWLGEPADCAGGICAGDPNHCWLWEGVCDGEVCG